MDQENFSESDGLGSPIQLSQYEGSESERGSEGGDMVEAGMETSQAAVEASIEVSPEGLFTRRNRRLTFGGATPGTSLFSERTRTRWELQDQEIQARGGDHTAYATHL
jgi:hypothetical protein